MKFITDVDMAAKRVLMRLDLNVPLKDGKIEDDTRIRASLPSCRAVLARGASQLILMSHLGRPKSSADSQFSLAPVAVHMESLLGSAVSFVPNLPHTKEELPDNKIVLLENTRFWPGETQNDDQLARQLASLADVFVMDAFASSHRAHASTYGVARQLPIRCCGLLVQRELEALNRALADPVRPVLVILGGAKVSDKLPLLETLINLTDSIILGGGIVNTFLAASGVQVGKSLYEPALIETARRLMSEIYISLPQDVAVAPSLAAETRTEKRIEHVNEEDMILDIGGITVGDYGRLIEKAKTIIWNGPLGVFEKAPFAAGTEALAKAIASSPAFTLAGGGDTIAAINRFIDPNRIGYISTAGGAFLEYVEKGRLPALAVLEDTEPNLPR